MNRLSAPVFLLIGLCALFAFGPTAAGAEPPVVEAIVDQATGALLWSSDNPTVVPTLKPGQAILLRGRNFGPGPITAARPGLAPPAGGLPVQPKPVEVGASPAEPAGKELSKVLFGRVRALERNLS